MFEICRNSSLKLFNYLSGFIIIIIGVEVHFSLLTVIRVRFFLIIGVLVIALINDEFLLRFFFGGGGGLLSGFLLLLLRPRGLLKL